MKQGFTLAETLITIGIIGIVAAMTIPTLIHKCYEIKTISQLRETQSILAQAFKMAEEEYGDIEGWFTQRDSVTSALEMGEHLKPFLKLALDCAQSDNNNKCVPNLYYKERNGAARAIYTGNIYYKVKLLNGSSVWWLYSWDETIAHIYVDTNGINKPNIWGQDFFMFEYSKNSLRPMGAPDSLYPYSRHCIPKTSTGVGCAYYVLNQGNMNYLH